MKIKFYKGWLNRKALLNGYYLHPTIKLQPYKRGFELVIWFAKGYVSVMITWY